MMETLTNQEILISASGLHKIFKSPGGELEILQGVNLNIRQGEMCFILGRSGAGKSTLLNILASLDKPNQGQVLFRGENLVKWPESRLMKFRNQNIGFIFQSYHLLPELTVLENVMMPAMMAAKKNRKEKALDLLKKLGLEKRVGHFPGQLSGGECQRTVIARALVNDPDIVFCDEPTGNLDEHTAEEVFELLMHLKHEEKRTFCVVTHEESLIQDPSSVYWLHEGRLQTR